MCMCGGIDGSGAVLFGLSRAEAVAISDRFDGRTAGGVRFFDAGRGGSDMCAALQRELDVLLTEILDSATVELIMPFCSAGGVRIRF